LPAFFSCLNNQQNSNLQLSYVGTHESCRPSAFVLGLSSSPCREKEAKAIVDLGSNVVNRYV
jgi:hypothetical protein